jgi:hypothetical protein
LSGTSQELCLTTFQSYLHGNYEFCRIDALPHWA